MKIRMVVNKIGYPTKGTILEVAEDRATRWVLDKGLAEFAEKKDRQTVEKKIEATKKEAAKADKQLNRELDQLEED